MNMPIPLYPRHDKMTEASWLVSTRKYISKYDVLDAYKIIHGIEPSHPPSADQLANIFRAETNRDALITIEIASHSFNKDLANEYLRNSETKSFGIALAIEYRMLEKLIGTASEPDIFLYLTEYILNDDELSLIAGSDLMHSLSQRIVDEKQTMYTVLVKNFFELLKINDHNVINENFISNYISHASFYNGNPLLEYILRKYPNAHPLFEDLDCLACDPFTRSRRYSHWLRTTSRMNEIARYYLEINSTSKTISINRAYIGRCIKCISIYK